MVSLLAFSLTVRFGDLLAQYHPSPINLRFLTISFGWRGQAVQADVAAGTNEQVADRLCRTLEQRNFINHLVLPLRELDAWTSRHGPTGALIDWSSAGRQRVAAMDGVVVSISRYPVKSMRPEPLDAAELHWTWMHGDRQYAFVRAGNTSDFPWLTARDLPSLVRFGARYVKPSDPRHSKLIVTDPEGAEFDIRDPRLTARLADEAGMPIWLLRLGRGGFDAMPVSILATTTAAAVERVHGAPVAVGRFRANIVIRPDDPAVDEQDWIGRNLQFGAGNDAVRLHVDWATPRCAMVGIDPGTGERDQGVVRTVAQCFQNRVGAYCAVREPGTIRIGDRVTSDPAL